MMESPQDRCRRYRRRILEASRQVGAAHVAPAFSCLEIIDALYHGIMRPGDIFIMSKGHGCLAQYAVLEDVEWGGSPSLDDYGRPGSPLGAHPDYNPRLEIHASTGSLGHGLGIAAGQALAERMKDSDRRVFVLLSDGECQEGSTWEAAMVAANLRLGNLVVLVDCNDWGGMDRMSAHFPATASPALILSKWVAFGWGAVAVDGHDSCAVAEACACEQLAWFGKDGAPACPRAIICRTVKGKGVSFIESGQPLWHYRSPTEEEYARALEELA